MGRAMFARFALAALLLALAGCTTPGKVSSLSPHSPYTAKALAASCQGRDGWSDPAPPARVFGNTWYVGTCGISALLVTSDAGHILVDTGMADAAPLVAANIERLGFRLKDVRWIVTSHEHFDHVAGLAELQRLTGARVAVLPVAAAVFASGQPAKDDPQLGQLEPIAPVKVDRVMGDGEVLELGPLRLTAHATPAHSPGSTSWTWGSCEDDECRIVTYADSASTISTEGYRFIDHPDRVAGVRKGLAAMDALPCGILITPHPSASDLFGRFATGRLLDPAACHAYAARAAASFDARLAKESAGG